MWWNCFCSCALVGEIREELKGSIDQWLDYSLDSVCEERRKKVNSGILRESDNHDIMALDVDMASMGLEDE